MLNLMIYLTKVLGIDTSLRQIKEQFNKIKGTISKNKKVAFMKPKVAELIGDNTPLDEKNGYIKFRSY